MATTQTNPNPVWRRWFRRTDVYIAEYILMLLLLGSFLGIASSLWFSFFGLILNDSYSGRSLAEVTAGQLGGLIVLGIAGFWMYSRVTGQEMIEPGVYEKKARTVFLTIWMIGVVLGVVGLAGVLFSSLSTSLFGLGDDVGKTLVGTTIPALFAIATLVFGLFMVVKRVSRKFVMMSAIVVAALSAVLLVANVTMVVVRKDAPTRTDCMYALYVNSRCQNSNSYNYLNNNSSNNYDSFYN